MRADTTVAFEIPGDVAEALRGVVERGGPTLESCFRERKVSLLADVQAAIARAGMLAPLGPFREFVDARPAPSIDAVSFRQSLLARFALNLPSLLGPRNLPASVLELYPDLVDRLSRTIVADEDAYDVDAYARDVCHVTGLFYPAAAQDIDWNATLRARMFVANALKRARLAEGLRYLGGRFWRRSYDIHTDGRHTARFTPEGWERTYLCLADLMETDVDVPGFFGTSWFYDPTVAEISPRLAYLQTTPLSGGAFLVWNGPGDIHTQRATKTSKTRRKLFEDGKYTPTCYTLVWPRAALLRWARGHRAGA